MIAHRTAFLLLTLATCSNVALADRSLDAISSLLELDHDRHLKGDDDLLKCPDNEFDETIYNIYVEVDNVPDKCGEDDREAIGYLIEDIVDETEDEIPVYKGEKMEAKICKHPEPTTTSRSLFGSTEWLRRLARSYTYRGSGRCRRCRRRRTSTRNLGRSLGDEPEFESYVDEACHYAEAGSFYADMAESALESANSEFDELLELLPDFYDQDKGKQQREKALESLEKCEEEALNTLDAATMCMSWCEKAEKERSEKEQEKYSEESKDAYEDVAEAAEEARESYYEVKKLKWELIELSTKNEYKAEMDEFKESIEATAAEMEQEIEELLEDIEDLKKDLKDEKDKQKKKKMEEDLETLKDEIVRLENWEANEGKFLEEQEKQEEKIALARLAVQAVNTEDNYYKKMKKLIEMKCSSTLMKSYNDTDPPGCFSMYAEPRCKVTIEPTTTDNQVETGPGCG